MNIRYPIYEGVYRILTNECGITGWLRYKIKSHRIINLKHTEYEEDFICSFSCTGNHKLLTE